MQLTVAHVIESYRRIDWAMGVGGNFHLRHSFSVSAGRKLCAPVDSVMPQSVYFVRSRSNDTCPDQIINQKTKANKKNNKS